MFLHIRIYVGKLSLYSEHIEASQLQNSSHHPVLRDLTYHSGGWYLFSFSEALGSVEYQITQCLLLREQTPIPSLNEET